MKIKAALGRTSRPLPLNTIRLVSPSSQKSLTARIGCSIGVSYLNAAINNNYVNLANGVMLDKAYDAKLSDVINAFDVLGSRIPATMARSLNANKAFFSGVKHGAGGYGIPADVISRLLVSYGQPTDRYSYYIVGATVALMVHKIISNIDPAKGFVQVSTMLDDLQKYVDEEFSPESKAGMFDAAYGRIKVSAFAHVSNIKGILLSVLEDYVAGNTDRNREGYAKSDDGMNEDVILADTLKVFDDQLWYYYALMVHSKNSLKVSISKEHSTELFEKMPSLSSVISGADVTTIVDIFNAGGVKDAQGGWSTRISDYRAPKGLSEVGPSEQEYKSQGFTAVKAFNDTALESFSSQSNTDVLNSLGLKQVQVSKLIAQLYDLAAIMSRGNSLSDVIEQGIQQSIQSNAQAIQSYLNLLTALLGATEDGARLLVADFLAGTEWNGSLASVLYRHATLGSNLRTVDISDKFSALTLSKDGLVGHFKAGDIEITVAKDALSLGGNSEDSSSRISISQFGNPFEDAFFRSSKRSDLKTDKEDKVPIIFMKSDATSNAFFSLIDVINSGITGITHFISRGSISQIDTPSVEIANELLGPSIINYISDSVKMRSIGRNSGLVIGSDYTISADARKAMMDQIGIIDAALAASSEIIGSCIIRGVGARVAPALDVLKGLSDINKQRATISSMTSFYVPGDEETDTAMSDSFSRINTIMDDVLGLTISNELPASDSDANISLTVPAGADISTRDMLRLYSDLVGSFESKKKFNDGKRKILSTFDRFNIQKKNSSASLKMGNSAYALLWDKIKNVEGVNLIAEPTKANFANIVSSSILLQKLKNGSMSSLTTRGPEELRMTGRMPLSHIRDRSPRKLVSIGLDGDLRMVTNMFKFINANAASGISDKQVAVGKILSLAIVGRDMQRYSISGAQLNGLLSVETALNGSSAFSVVNPLDQIVRIGSISASNFAAIDLKTFYGSSGDDLLYNILDAVGLYPYSTLSFTSAQILLTYNAIRSSDYKYPFVNRMRVSDLVAGEEYTYMDLLDIAVGSIHKEDSYITNHYSCSVFMWTEGRDKNDSTLELFDVGEKMAVVVADEELIDLSQIDNNVELCIESTVDLPFGQKLSPGLSEQMLLSMADKLENLI